MYSFLQVASKLRSAFASAESPPKAPPVPSNHLVASAPPIPAPIMQPVASPRDPRMMRVKQTAGVSPKREADIVSDPLQPHSPALKHDSPSCNVMGSGGKRQRSLTDENSCPSSPSIKRAPCRATPNATPKLSNATPKLSNATPKLSNATPKATPSRTAATPSRSNQPSSNKPPSSTRTPLSSRKRPSTPVNSVEMNALSSQKQRQLATLPPALGFAAANAAHVQFLSSKSYVDSLQQQRQRWDKFLVLHPGVLATYLDPTPDPYRNDIRFKDIPDVAELCRDGIPSHLRGDVWQALLGSRLKALESAIVGRTYQWYLDQVDPASPAVAEIYKDVGRTFPEHEHYKRGKSSSDRSGDGLEELARVLSAYSVYNPDVGYCQGMNFVTALLLLTASEVDVFWMLVALVHDVLPARFYDRTMLGATVELDLLGLLIERELPDAAAHLRSLGVIQHSFTAPWIICLFLNVLPVETTLRVWDAMFCDGVVALHRVGTALLRMKQDELLKCKEFVGTMQFLSSFTLGAFNFDVIMREAYADLSVSLSGDGAVKRLFRRFTKPFADVDRVREKLFAQKVAAEPVVAQLVTVPAAFVPPPPPSAAIAAASSSAADDAWVSGELFDFDGEGAAACDAVTAASAATPALPSWLAPNFGERYNRLSFLVLPPTDDAAAQAAQGQAMRRLSMSFLPALPPPPATPAHVLSLEDDSWAYTGCTPKRLPPPRTPGLMRLFDSPNSPASALSSPTASVAELPPRASPFCARAAASPGAGLRARAARNAAMQ